MTLIDKDLHHNGALQLQRRKKCHTELSMEAAYMRRSLKAQQRLLDKIPQEVMEELKRAKVSRDMVR